MASEVRIVGILRIKDRRAAIDVLQRVCDVARTVDGAEVWEAFADDDSDVVYVNERFESEAAFRDYEAAVDAEGLRRRVVEALEMDRLLLLSPVDDTRLTSDLDALGAITVRAVASI